jgi:hypothetical protein
MTSGMRRRTPVRIAPAILLAAAAMAIGGVAPARAWRVKTVAGLPIFRGVIAIAPDGDVLADVGAGRTIDDRSILLERHDGRSGKRRWRQRLATPGGAGRRWRRFEMQKAARAPFAQPVADPAPPQALTQYTGTFRNPVYGDVTVERDGERLRLTAGPAKLVMPLVHRSRDTFILSQPDLDAFLGDSGSRRSRSAATAPSPASR